MREIKFRGLPVDDEIHGDSFINGSLSIGCTTSTSKIIEYGIHQYNCYPIEVKPETIGQFTGIFDKNKEPIFEGDIISISFTTYGQQPYTESKYVTRTGIVRYYPSKGFVLTKIIEVDNDTGYMEKNISRMNINSSRSIIIGNIHQNPELL